MQQTTIQIEGMTCDHCVGGVTKALSSVEGVNVRSVNVGSATVEYDEARVSRAQIDAAIDGAGYTVRREDSARA